MEKQMIQELAIEVGKKLGIEGVTYKEVTKNNGVQFVGVEIPIDKNIKAVVYVNDACKGFLEGEVPMDVAADRIVECFNRRDTPEVIKGGLENALSSKADILKRVRRILVNRCMNTDKKDTCPNKPFFDLAVFYRVFLGANESILVTNEFMKTYGISIDELDKAGQENDRKSYMDEHILEILKRINPLASVFEPDDFNMRVISAKSMTYGATAILDEEYMENFSKHYDGNFFIIPSSIHEVITIPADENADPRDVRSMVCAVNRTELSPSDILSDSVYIWNAQTHQVEIVV